MSHKDLVELVDEKTKDFNEWSKFRNPEKWDEKYKIFLKKNKSEKNKIMGRVV